MIGIPSGWEIDAASAWACSKTPVSDLVDLYDCDNSEQTFKIEELLDFDFDWRVVE